MAELWERQKGEREASYIYFTIYWKELKHTPKKLQDVIDYIESLSAQDSYRQYKSDLIKVPTLNQLQQLSSKWQWQDRIAAHTNYTNKKDEDARDEKYHKQNDAYTDSFGKDLEDWDKLSQELEQSDYSLSTRVHLKLDIQKGKDIAYKNYRLGNGRSISISESKNEHKVDAEVQYSGLKDLAEAFNEGKRKYLKDK